VSAAPRAPLDGGSFASALVSVADQLDLDIDRLRAALLATHVPDAEVGCASTCFDAVLRTLQGRPPGVALLERIRHASESAGCVWFHATRVVDPLSFRIHGVLPLNRARAILEPQLRLLAQGLERQGDSPYSGSMASKMDADDCGPHAFLLRSAAILAPGANHQYMNAPEYVEDFAGLLLGANGGVLVDRFRKAAKPCLIKFRGGGSLRHLQHLMQYTLLRIHGYNEETAAEIANTCFSPTGADVQPADIVEVEQFDSEEHARAGVLR
jgi:hypothetical protein